MVCVSCFGLLLRGGATMSPEKISASSEAFFKAYESILESLAEDVNKRRKKLTADDQKLISSLHKLVSKHGFSMPPAGEGNLCELSESLLYEWEESAPPSSSIQQLASLLSKPTVKSLFSAHDSVANRRYSPQLPDVPFEVDDDDGIAVKIVRLVKGNEPLGATIKTDADGSVFIARIIAGGVADRSACIQVRDRVMEVNGVSVTGMKPSEIVTLLNSDNGSVTFKLIPAEIPSIVECSEARYLRAMMDYAGSRDQQHPCPEAALSFRKGEILELLVTGDEHWWQATSLGFGAFASSSNSYEDSNSGQKRVGLVPSELLHLKRRTIWENEEKSKVQNKKSSKSSLESTDAPLYESVSLLFPNAAMIRPIVLIGPPGVGRNELKRRLIISNCERYGTTVPHTSRPPRAHETKGVDYYFAKREEMEIWIRQGRFLEFGEYKGNLYGTLADSVLAVMKQGRTPVLNPHPLALRLLCSATFKPFIIFVQPPEFKVLKETRTQQRLKSPQSTENRRSITAGSAYSRSFTDAELEQMIAVGEQISQVYGHCFDLTIVNGNLELAFSQLCQAINRLDTQPSWVPSSWID